MVAICLHPKVFVYTSSPWPGYSQVEIEQIEWFRLQSNPIIDNYYLVIVVSSGPHLSIYDMFYTLENTQSLNSL